jgi:hypothetical protein
MPRLACSFHLDLSCSLSLSLFFFSRSHTSLVAVSAQLLHLANDRSGKGWNVS